jgi:hypothetical protein
MYFYIISPSDSSNISHALYIILHAKTKTEMTLTYTYTDLECSYISKSIDLKKDMAGNRLN